MTATRSRTQFAQVPTWVFLHPAIRKPLTTLHIYVVLCAMANFRDRVCDGDWEKLSKASGLGRTTVFDALKLMTDVEIIFLQPDGFYWLPMDDPSATADFLSATADSESADTDCSLYTEINSEESEVTPLKPKEYSAVIHELCEQLQQRIGEHKGHKPRVTDTWLRDMDLLRRRGCGSWAVPEPIDVFTIGDVINGVFDLLATRGPKGFCWADNI